MDQARLAVYGLDETDREILALLDEGLHKAEVARRLDVHRSTITRRVRDMEERGAVRAVAGRSPTLYEVPKVVKSHLKDKGLWGHKRRALRPCLVIQKAERRFRVFPRNGAGVACNGSELHRRLGEVSRVRREGLPGRFAGEVDHRNWTGYKYLFRGYELEVTSRKIRVRPVGDGVEVPVLPDDREEDGGRWGVVRDAEERAARRMVEVVEAWAREAGRELLVPVQVEDGGWMYGERHYALGGLEEGVRKELESVAGELYLSEDVERRMWVDRSPPGGESGQEIETDDRATAENLVRMFAGAARDASLMERLEMRQAELRAALESQDEKLETMGEALEGLFDLLGAAMDAGGAGGPGESRDRAGPGDSPMFR